jgi:hypothetical protein
MKKITYHCDFCKKEVKEKDLAEISIPVDWVLDEVGNKKVDVQIEEFELCQECLQGTLNDFNKIIMTRSNPDIKKGK